MNEKLAVAWRKWAEATIYKGVEPGQSFVYPTTSSHFYAFKAGYEAGRLNPHEDLNVRGSND